MSKFRDKLVDVLRAEANGVDLIEDEASQRIIVVAQTQEDAEHGQGYELGSVSMSAAMQDPEGALRCISRIKFSPSTQRNR